MMMTNRFFCLMKLEDNDSFQPLKERLELVDQDLKSAESEIFEKFRSVRCEIDYSAELAINSIHERRMEMIDDMRKYEKEAMAKFEREKDSVNALIDECSSFVQNHSNLSFNSLDKNTRAFQTRLDAAARHIEECKTDNIVHFESWEPVKPIFGQIGTLNYKKKRLDQIISREKDLQSKIYSFQRFYPVNEEIRLIWSGRLLRLNNGKYYNVFNRNDNHVCINVYDKDLKTLGKSKTLLSPFQHAGMSISSYGFKNRIYICWADRRMNDALALLIAVDEELNIVSRNDSLSGEYDGMIHASDHSVLIQLKQQKILLLDNQLILLHCLYISQHLRNDLFANHINLSYFDRNMYDFILLNEDPTGSSRCLLFKSFDNHFQLLSCQRVTKYNKNDYQVTVMKKFLFTPELSKPLRPKRYIMCKFDDLDDQKDCDNAIKCLIGLFCESDKIIYILDAERNILLFQEQVDLQFKKYSNIRVLQLTKDLITLIDDEEKIIYEYKLSFNFSKSSIKIF